MPLPPMSEFKAARLTCWSAVERTPFSAAFSQIPRLMQSYTGGVEPMAMRTPALETEYSLRVNTVGAAIWELARVYENPCLEKEKLVRFSFLVGKRPYVDCKQCKSREK
jgi:hypothetical protein